MNNNLQCKIAETTQERDQVYRLRYQGYRRDDSIDATPSESFRDEIDADANHFSFLVGDQDKQSAVATVRISVVRPDLGWCDSPGMHIFGDHPALVAIARESFVEASRLCFAGQAGRDAFVSLLGHMAAMADFYEVEWLVACPRVEHASVYRHLFGFERLAAPRQYYGVRFQTELLAIRRTALHSYVSKKRVMVEASEDALRMLSSSTLQTMPLSAFGPDRTVTVAAC